MNVDELDKQRRRLRSRTPLLGAWFQDQAVRTLAEDGSAGAIRLLEEAAVDQSGDACAAAAFATLARLAHEENTPAREALCRLVIHYGHPGAYEVATAQNYLPHEERQRAVYLFLTGRWDEYDKLDFDRRLLRAAYETAEPSLRNRLATQARRAGRVDWVEVASGGRQGRRLAQMTDSEWRAALTVLIQNERWSDLWRLGQEAPPGWSAAILRRCPVAKLGDSDRQGLVELHKLAQAWPPDEFSRNFYHRHTFTGHAHEISCLAIDAKSGILASGSRDQTVRLWDLTDLKALAVCAGHTDWLTAVAFVGRHNLLVSSGRDGRLCSWGIPAGERRRRLQRRRRPFICLGIWRPEGLAAGGGADGTLLYWDPRDGTKRFSAKAHEASISCLAIDSHNALCVTGGGDARVSLWTLPDGKHVRTLSHHRAQEADAVLCLAVSPDGTTLASGGTDGKVILSNLPGGSERHQLDAHNGKVTVLAFSPDARLLASGGDDRRIRLWDTQDGRELESLTGHHGDINALLISPAGDLLASSGGGGLGVDRQVRLWSLPDGKPLAALGGHQRSVEALAFSSTGDVLCTGGGDGNIAVWSTELGRLARQPVNQSSFQDLSWLQAALAGATLSPEERAAMNFIIALIRWRRRSDILVEEAGPRRIEIGAFDIEIEG
jgi:WD40 repeat protein